MVHKLRVDDESFHDTARLLLMEQSNMHLATFHAKFKEIHEDDFVNDTWMHATIWDMYAKYHGVDGRPPTHSIETGGRLYWGPRKKASAAPEQVTHDPKRLPDFPT